MAQPKNAEKKNIVAGNPPAKQAVSPLRSFFPALDSATSTPVSTPAGPGYQRSSTCRRCPACSQ